MLFNRINCSVKEIKLCTENVFIAIFRVDYNVWLNGDLFYACFFLWLFV